MKITAYKIGYSDKKDPDRVRYRIKNPLYLYFEMPCGTSRRVGFKSWSKGIDPDEEDADSKGDAQKTAYDNLRAFLYTNPTQANAYTQFRCYINNITDMSQLEYYFDSRNSTISESYVKGCFKDLLYNGTTLTTQGDEIFNLIWANTTFRGDLFPEIDFNQPDNIIRPIGLKQFKDIVSSTGNKFYNFINVK